MKNINSTSTRNYLAIISFLTLLISFKSSNQWSKLPIGNEFFWWIVQVVFIYILLKIKNVFTAVIIEKNITVVKMFLSWNLICIIRGVFIAENYWEFKTLMQTSFFLSMPLIVYLANSRLSIQLIIKTWFRYGIFLFIFFSPFLFGDAIGKFLFPVSFSLIFYSILNIKWKTIVIFLTVLMVFLDIKARSNILVFFTSFLIGNLYRINSFLSIKFLNFSRLFLLILPFFLLILGSSGIFNIFKLEEILGEKQVDSLAVKGQESYENVISDTRTFLYFEVIESAVNNNYILFGRTPARGNDSMFFGDYNKEKLKTGKNERFANEVSILNIFTWLGFVGVILYFLIFVKATYLAINESNNFFIKLIGLNVSFRWVFAFIEDFSEFNLSNIFLWLMIGMCLSKTFREMNNRQMKNWFLSIFDSTKYLKSYSNTVK